MFCINNKMIIYTFKDKIEFHRMKGENLGEFEEVVLLTIAALLDDAYSVAVCDHIEKMTGRKVKLGVVHAVLNRMEKKGYILSELGNPTKERGGKRKRYFTISHAGKIALMKSKDQRDKLWDVIPKTIFQGI